MSTRLTQWVREQMEHVDDELSLAAGLDNGDVARPEWLASSPCTGIGYALWDTDESDGHTHLYALDTEQAETT